MDAHANTALERFVRAQETVYDTALREISQGWKQSHWMWFIFPQVAGLGHSEMSRRYAISDIEEAQSFLAHPLLGPRLINICKALSSHRGKTAHQIFGSPDDMKLKSSMTLFAAVPGADPIFEEVLKQFFGGQRDKLTLSRL